MKLSHLASIVVCCFCFGCSTPAPPFSRLDAEAKRYDYKWMSMSTTLAKPFQEERSSLGQDFPKHLTQYMGSDTDKHYMFASFLLHEPYLGGSEPDPDLALLIIHQAIAICQADTTDIDTKAELVSLSIRGATLAEQLGFSAQAVAHKQRAESLLKDHPILRGAIPAQSDETRELYKSIPEKIKK